MAPEAKTGAATPAQATGRWRCYGTRTTLLDMLEMQLELNRLRKMMEEQRHAAADRKWILESLTAERRTLEDSTSWKYGFAPIRQLGGLLGK